MASERAIRDPNHVPGLLAHDSTGTETRQVKVGSNNELIVGGLTGTSASQSLPASLALKITEVGAVTYVALANPGTAQASALWQVQKIDSTTGTVVTWADGNANYDNVATDLTTLSYS